MAKLVTLHIRKDDIPILQALVGVRLLFNRSPQKKTSNQLKLIYCVSL